MAEREARLPQVGVGGRLYLSCDAQDYGINWINKKDRRSVQLEGTCIADNRSMYVFASVLNYDPAHKPQDINAEAERIGDLEKPRCYRRFARFWLEKEYKQPTIIYRGTVPVPPSRPEDYEYDGLGAGPDDDPADIPPKGWPTGDEFFDAILDLSISTQRSLIRRARSTGPQRRVRSRLSESRRSILSSAIPTPSIAVRPFRGCRSTRTIP